MEVFYKETDIEILIATRNRNSLDFLDPMFPSSHFSQYSILIINQTEPGTLLVSDYSNVRVINSFEKGVSKSRNLAIKNAKKEICLIADDDVVYFPNLEKTISSAFNQNPNASIITFNHQRIGLNKPQNSSLKTFRHTKKSIWKVSSIEIAFKLDVIKNNKIVFDEYFGLGSYFETAEEFLFLRNCLEINIKAYFSPAIIVSHPLLSSGNMEGNDELLFARAALFYKTKGKFAFMLLAKYVFFLFRKNYIQRNECLEKYKIGLAGIHRYKELVKLKL